MVRQALVVDDSRAMRTILSGIVASLGFECRHAGDGREALEALADGEVPELALVDWNMPTMSGLQLVREIRRRDELAGLKVVMVTTETERDRVTEALEAGADEYIMKPFDREMLLDKLALAGVEAPAGPAGAV